MFQLASRAAIFALATFALTWSPSAAARMTFSVPMGTPRTLIIPSIGVKAPVEAVDLSKKSEVDAPHRWGDVAWYNGGPKPGEQGHAAIFGHLDSTCCAAVFYRLRDLKPGETVQVTYPGSRVLTFRIMWLATYPTNKLPLDFIFGSSNDRALILMTCTGVFHRDGTGYDHRLAVYARLVMPNGKLG